MQEFTIGRSPDNSIIINDSSVSRRHATLIIAQNEYSVKDLGSANGTFVNGMRVAGASRLQSNDILKVGNSVVPWMNYISMGGHNQPAPSALKKPKTLGCIFTLIIFGALILFIGGLFKGCEGESELKIGSTYGFFDYGCDFDCFECDPSWYLKIIDETNAELWSTPSGKTSNPPSEFTPSPSGSIIKAGTSV